MDGFADHQDDVAVSQLGDDVSGVGARAGQAVKAGNHEGVARPARRHRLAQAGPGPCGAAQPDVEGDPQQRHPQP